MRSVQVMRHGRRMTASNNDLNPTMNCSWDFSSSKRRYSTLSFANRQDKGSQRLNEHNKILTHRRNTVHPNLNILGRRISIQQKDAEALEKSKKNLKNFYVFFLTLFVFLFLSVVYSFIRMMTKPI